MDDSFINAHNIRLNKITVKKILPLQIFNDYNDELTRIYNKDLFNHTVLWDNQDDLCFNSTDSIWVD